MAAISEGSTGHFPAAMAAKSNLMPAALKASTSKFIPPGMPFIAGPPFACEAPFVPGDVLDEASALLEAEALIASWSTGHLPARILSLLIPILLEMASLNTLLSHFFLVLLRTAICQSPARNPAEANAVDTYTSYLTQIMPNNVFPVRLQTTLTLLLPYAQHCYCLSCLYLGIPCSSCSSLETGDRFADQPLKVLIRRLWNTVKKQYCLQLWQYVQFLQMIFYHSWNLSCQTYFTPKALYHTNFVNAKSSNLQVTRMRTSYFNSLWTAMTTLQQIFNVQIDSLIEIGNNTLQPTQQNFISARTCWDWSWEMSQQLEIRRVR